MDPGLWCLAMGDGDCDLKSLNTQEAVRALEEEEEEVVEVLQ